jgi:NAD(P)-dependent dehydrogenase (short-subunit alcohol dehydrogenase family)
MTRRKRKPTTLALVTGAASGIGRATTLRLLADGLRVLALDRSGHALADLAKEAGTKSLIPVTADLSDTASLDALARELLDRHGPVAHLVNNAGVWDGSPIIRLSDEAWARNFAVNVTAPFVLMRAWCRR